MNHFCAEMRGRDLIQWRGGVEYYLDEENHEEPRTEVHPESIIAFFVNGQCQEIAFSDVQAGKYYPTGVW